MSAWPLLIVEDCEEDFVAMERYLRRAGIANPIDRCIDGDEALAYLRDRPRPAMIFLDLDLPGTNGRDVLTKVKADPALREIPLLVLTASEDDEDVKRSYREGANTYLRKPSHPEEFAAVFAAIRGYWFGRGVRLV